MGIVLHLDPTLFPELLQVPTYTKNVKVTKTNFPQAVKACFRMTTYWGDNLKNCTRQESIWEKFFA